ncbi:MAG: alpha/beta hydrolase, partial [Planctomycetales bacterium]
RSVFDLNAEFAKELARKRTANAKDSPAALRAKIAKVIGMRPLDQQKPPTWKDKGRVERKDYHIDKLVMKTDAGIPLPALTFHPKDPADAAYLYLHDDGKLGDSQAGGPIEKLVGEGYAVVTVDLRGQGETSTGKRNDLLGDWKTYYLSYLLGKPLLGPRVEDALAAAHFVAYYQKAKDDPREVHLVGVGQAGVVALHAAAMRPDLFTSVTLRDAPRDWTSLIQQPVPAGQLDGTAHGALEVYDLPDLTRLIGKDKVR